jgi:hypothetical protein
MLKEINISSTNLEVLNSILFFSIKFIEKIDKFDFGTSILHKEIYLKLGEGSYDFLFKNIEYSIEYIKNKIHPPIDCSPEYIYFSEVKIKSKELENINNFIKDSIDYYKNNILKEKYSSGKVNVFSLNSGSWILFNKIEKRSINTIYLPDELNLKILNTLKSFLSLENYNKYINAGIIYKKNLLFNGPPGTGKTSLIISLASELNLNIYFLPFDKNITDSNFLRIIKNIKENSILVIEDSEFLLKDKKNITSLMAILNIMDGIASKSGLIIIITTNKTDGIEPALLRAGRIDNFYSFDFIKSNESLQMLNKLSNDKKNIDLFLKNINKVKISPADLQQYLLNNTNLMDNIDDLIKSKNDNFVSLYA